MRHVNKSNTKLFVQPKTSFVADFVGTSNVINSELALQITGNHQPFSIRPEHIEIFGKQAKILKVSGEVADIQYHGATSKIQVDVSSQLISIVLSNTENSEAELPKIGEKIILCWPQSSMVML